MEQKSPQQWLSEQSLSSGEVDCVVALMLKILDGKCKMNAADKAIIQALYPEVQSLPGQRLPMDLRDLIDEVGESPDAEQRTQIYEQRVLAETMISRPVMKAFKARLRGSGLLPARVE